MSTEPVFDPLIDTAIRQRCPEPSVFSVSSSTPGAFTSSRCPTRILVTVPLLTYGRLGSGVSQFPGTRTSGRIFGNGP